MIALTFAIFLLFMGLGMATYCICSSMERLERAIRDYYPEPTKPPQVSLSIDLRWVTQAIEKGLHKVAHAVLTAPSNRENSKQADQENRAYKTSQDSYGKEVDRAIEESAKLDLPFYPPGCGFENHIVINCTHCGGQNSVLDRQEKTNWKCQHCGNLDMRSAPQKQ